MSARPRTGRPPGRPRAKLAGMTFGALTVESHAGHNLDGRRLVRCRCVCGARVVVRAEDLSKRRVGCAVWCGGDPRQEASP